ncbi:MAG: transposase [Lewinellaceae bacterium]|nr:transposase [Lewinellaceae bacterium]
MQGFSSIANLWLATLRGQPELGYFARATNQRSVSTYCQPELGATLHLKSTTSVPIFIREIYPPCMNNVYYERNLPHWQPPGGTFFLTYRLHGSIPMPTLHQIKQEIEAELSSIGKTLSGNALKEKKYEIQRRCFGKYDKALDENPNAPYWLRDDAVARQVIGSLQYCAEVYFHMWAFCIVPNHVHLLIRHREDAPLLCEILKKHKGYTERMCNALIGQHGKFWNRETFDHLVRNEVEFDRIVHYILNNPVKAKLVKSWQDWPYTYVHPDLL